MKKRKVKRSTERKPRVASSGKTGAGGGAARAIPVAGIGASAGGLEAVEKFFDCMPNRPGIAFVIITHLDPAHVSLMPKLIGQHTRMAVEEVRDGMHTRQGI